MRKSFSITRNNLRALPSSPHFWVILILSALYMEYIFEPIRLYLQDNGAKIGLFDLMTYYLNDATVSGFMALGCLGLLFNIPYSDDMQRYMLLRCGRKTWAKGQIYYCLYVCVFYMLFLTSVLFILILPWLDTGTGWSQGILAFVNDFAYETYDSFLNFDVWLPEVYTPFAAFGIEFILHILIFFMLGILLADVNMIFDRRAGFIVIAVPTSLDLLLEEYFPEIVKYFSPLTCCRLSGLDYGDGMGRPPVWYSVISSAILGAVFSLILINHVRRKEIKL